MIPAENTPLMQNDVETLSTNESNSQESKPLSQLENGDSLESLPLDEEDLLENGDIPENTNSISENGQLPNESLSPAEMETISTAVTTARNAPQNVTTTVAIATTAPPKPQTQPPKTEAVIPETQPPKKEEVVNPAESYLLKGLQFYGGIDSERRKMSSYTQLYEYRSEEAGQPWQLIMEYENVPYLNRKCDAVLCFTSLGLVGINYFDGNTGNYRDWVNQLTDIYGSASDSQSDYTAWTGNPVGSGTAIYIFALEDDVQISFFADDSGSALS